MKIPSFCFLWLWILFITCFADPLMPSTVLSEIIRNSTKNFMSVSFLITRFKSLASVDIVMHCQQKNGRFFKSATCIELMCFRISQNRDVNPPKTNDFMSFTLHDPEDLSLVKESRSSQFLAPICCFTISSFLSSMERVLYFFISFIIFSNCRWSSSTVALGSSSSLRTELVLCFFLNFLISSSFLFSFERNYCFLASPSAFKRSSPILNSLGFRLIMFNFLPSFES